MRNSPRQRRSLTRILRKLVASAVAAVVLGQAVGAAAQTVEYYHLDALGSVRAITEQNAAVIERHDYLPFGEEWNPPPSIDARKFTGKERDVETGYDYFGARYLSAKTARFTTTDPSFSPAENLVDPQRWNRYTYARNNPLRYIDPDGRYEVDVHKDLTMVLAIAAGFSSPVAARIAAANQGVDDSSTIGPFVSKQAREDFHFTTVERRNELWKAFESSGKPEDLGVFLHAEQDSFSHAGFGPATGHLMAGHAPDKTFGDPAKADQMARGSYARLTAAAKMSGSHNAPVDPIGYREGAVVDSI